MNVPRDASSVREIILNMLPELGMDSADFCETILIRDGHYAGRRFEFAGGRAIWFVNEDQVKFYSESALLKTLRLTEVARKLQAA